MLFLIGAGSLLGLCGGLAAWWWREPHSPEEEQRAGLPKVVPLTGVHVPLFSVAASAGASAPTPVVIPLSKYRGKPPPAGHRRSVVPLAELPHASLTGCGICKGKPLVWLTAQSGGWVGLCRRCGLEVERVGSGWSRT